MVGIRGEAPAIYSRPLPKWRRRVEPKPRAIPDPQRRFGSQRQSPFSRPSRGGILGRPLKRAAHFLCPIFTGPQHVVAYKPERQVNAGGRLAANWRPLGGRLDSTSISGASSGRMDGTDDKGGDGGTSRPRIYLSPRPATLRYLNQLVSLGLYGSDPTQAAGRLVDEGIRLALREGLIRPEHD